MTAWKVSLPATLNLWVGIPDSRLTKNIIFLTYTGWAEVSGWVGTGGANLGTKRTLPAHRMGLVASRLQEFKIQALLIIGGFEVRRNDVC